MREVSHPLSIGRGSLIETRARAEARSATQSIALTLEAVVFYGLLGVITLTAVPYGTVEPWWVAIFECLVFFLGILATIEAFISRKSRGNWLSLSGPLAALALFIWLQSVSFSSAENFNLTLSADPHGSRLFAVKLLAFIVTGALLTRYVSTKARLRALVFTIIATGLVSAVFALVRKNTQTEPGFVLPYLSVDDRTFGQFINKNHFAFLMEMCLGLTLGLLLAFWRDLTRVIILLPIASLLWAALVISNSRGGVLGSLCELLFLGVMLDPVRRMTRRHIDHNQKRWQAVAGRFVLRGFLIGCLIVSFGYGVAWVGGESVVMNFQTADRDFSQSDALNNANTSRRQMWSMTWTVFKDHPLTGIGFGAYWIAITKYHDASGELTPRQAHNDYLDLLAAGGLLGAALALWFVVVFLRKAAEQLRLPDPYRRAACIGALTGIFGVAVHSFVDFGLHMTVNAAVFVVLIVIASAQLRPEE